MSAPIVKKIRVDELNSAWFSGVLKDERGVVVPSASLTALLLKLYNRTVDSIINSRNAVSVLNANGGTYHATNGTFEMTFASADNPIVDTTLAEGQTETHDALFVATWGSGGRKAWIVRLIVKQMRRVP